MKNGIAASKGYAIGKVFIQQHEEIQPPPATRAHSWPAIC